MAHRYLGGAVRSRAVTTSPRYIRSYQEYEQYMALCEQEAARAFERAFGVLQGRWGIIRQPARAFEISALKRIMYCCVMLHNMILEDEDFVVNLRDVFLIQRQTFHRDMDERCALHSVRKHKENQEDSKVHNDLRDDLVEHVWNRNY
ncbi:ALP1-like protein isoform X1 [Tanacetum coccineum]